MHFSFDLQIVGHSLQNVFQLMLWIIFTTCGNHIVMVLIVIYMLGLLQTVMAFGQDPTAFPDIPFKLFAAFIGENFSTKVSLTTVLTVLFTLTSNSDLLNLHARQQRRHFVEEQNKHISGWIKALSYALRDKLGGTTDSLFKSTEHSAQLSHDKIITGIGTKLNALSKLLELDPYNDEGQLMAQLKPVSQKTIEPDLVICPMVMECET